METEEYGPTLIHKELLTFIENNQNKPFYCFYALIQPHAEMFAPEEYMEKYRGKFLPESSYIGTDEGIISANLHTDHNLKLMQLLLVNNLDDYVGDIIDKLDELGISENTLIIFTSDNGPHQEAGHNPSYFDSNGPLKGFKEIYMKAEFV